MSHASISSVQRVQHASFIFFVSTGLFEAFITQSKRRSRFGEQIKIWLSC